MNRGYIQSGFFLDTLWQSANFAAQILLVLRQMLIIYDDCCAYFIYNIVL